MPYAALYEHGFTHAHFRAAAVLNSGYGRWRHAVVASLQEESSRNDPKRRRGVVRPEQMAPQSAFQRTSVVLALERASQIQRYSFFFFFQDARLKNYIKLVC